MISISNENIDDETIEVIQGGVEAWSISFRPKVEEFEKAFANYRGTKYAMDNLSIAEEVAHQVLSLPMHLGLCNQQLETIMEVLKYAERY